MTDETNNLQQNDMVNSNSNDFPSTASTPSTSASSDIPIRQNMVDAAVRFLNDPNVRSAPISRQLAFLEQKQLTRSEVERALQLARGESHSVTPALPSTPPPPPPSNENWSWRDVVVLGLAGTSAAFATAQWIQTSQPAFVDRVRRQWSHWFGNEQEEQEQQDPLPDRTTQALTEMLANIQMLRRDMDSLRSLWPQMERRVDAQWQTTHDVMRRELTSLKQSISQISTTKSPIVSSIVSNVSVAPLTESSSSSVESSSTVESKQPLKLPAWQLALLEQVSDEKENLSLIEQQSNVDETVKLLVPSQESGYTSPSAMIS